MILENKILFRDRKKFVLFVFIILIPLIIMNITKYLSSFIDYYINVEVENKSINRIFSISANEMSDIDSIEQIAKNNENIEYYYPLYERLYVNYNDTQIDIYNIFSNEEKVEGNLIKNFNDIVVTNTFLSYYDVDINDIIELNVNDEIIYVKIVGVVDSDNYRLIYGNSDFINIVSEKLNSKFIQYIVKIKNSKYISKFKTDLEKEKFRVSLYNDTGIKELERYTSLSKTLHIILIPIYVAIIALLYWVIKELIFNEYKNIALKKLIGYTNIRCLLDIFYKICVYIISSGILLTIFFLIARKILLMGNSDNILIDFLNNSNLYKSFFSIYIVFLMLYFIAFVLNIKKILKLDPILEINK